MNQAKSWGETSQDFFLFFFPSLKMRQALGRRIEKKANCFNRMGMQTGTADWSMGKLVKDGDEEQD